MIKYANPDLSSQVYDMWKTVFGDPDSYMQIYFREKYRDENTLVYIQDDKPVSSLQMLPITFTFHHREIDAAYYSGLCTLPECRKKGFMSALIKKSFSELYDRKIPLALLVPQGEELISFYEPYGFVKTFEAGNFMPPLPQNTSDDLTEDYKHFDNFFRNRDMTVQKNIDDFRVVIEEARLFDFPLKKSLPGMARVIDAAKLLQIFAEQNIEKSFSISVVDVMLKHNNVNFVVSNGKLKKSNDKEDVHFDVDASQLAQLLLGFQIDKMTIPARNIFPKKEPILGYMLE